MEKEFIPYNEAIKLKQLGFNEECFSFYNTCGMLIVSEFLFKNAIAQNTEVTAPLYQQVFRWFREKHKLIGFISFHSKGSFRIETLPKSKITLTSHKQRYFDNNGKLWKTYEEVELACLKKLIEIINP